MISIVIPTYNQRGEGPRMLNELLYSIEKQKGVEYEICISDNDDTGAIKNVVIKFEKILPIRYQFNPIKGASENINAAIEMAAYDNVKPMMMDDLFLSPNALKLFSDALIMRPWAAADSYLINGTGQRTGNRTALYDPNNFQTNTIGMPSVVAFRKNDIRFDARLKTFCDVYFYYQLYQAYGLPFRIASPVIGQRFHNASQSRNQPSSHSRDRNLLISEGKIPGKLPKVVVAVVVYNRYDNIDRWLRAWEQCNMLGAELVIIQNREHAQAIEYQSDTFFATNKIHLIHRPNIGYDIGAFQDVCKNRLFGFPDYDYLLWCTDDTIPMNKDFIDPFLQVIQQPRVGIACMQISTEYTRHVRTTGFMISKAVTGKLRFPADPVITKQHCQYFEHRGKRATLLYQIEAMRLKALQVSPLEVSPLYDMNFPYRNELAKRTAHLLDRMNEHNKIFNSNVQATH